MTVTRDDVLTTLLERYGTTYAEELQIDVETDTPSALFRLLCASMLMGARIGAPIAVAAAHELSRRGWRTAAALAQSTWDERVAALHEAGYTRYQERTATMLGDLAETLEEDYDGDLRKLRDAAHHDPEDERTRLKELKGVGDVSVDIFFREAQAAWPELRPFADSRVKDAARRLGLPKTPDQLAELAPDGDVTRLVAALARVELEDGYEAVRAGAR